MCKRNETEEIRLKKVIILFRNEYNINKWLMKAIALVSKPKW